MLQSTPRYVAVLGALILGLGLASAEAAESRHTAEHGSYRATEPAERAHAGTHRSPPRKFRTYGIHTFAHGLAGLGQGPAVGGSGYGRSTAPVYDHRHGTPSHDRFKNQRHYGNLLAIEF